MTAGRNIPTAVLERQLKASNPEQSVWVSANAGSGKTHVLVQRVLRHLLAGVPPAKILCLTFTKAAAANMANKVFANLARWTEIDDAELSAAIDAIGAGHPDAAQLLFARRLFARTVETPGGLKIHTIHAFCERLLHLFPFEANVPGRFEVLDDLGQAELLRLAKQEALKTAQSNHAALGQALQRVVAETSQDGFDELIGEAMRHRALFRSFAPDESAARLRNVLGIGPNETLESIERDMIEGGIAPSRWRQFADFFSEGSTTDQKKSALFLSALNLLADRATSLAAYLDVFFTQEGERRKSLATKALRDERPDLAAELDAEQTRLDTLRTERISAASFER
ncbi:MAG TPA: UvrD-helicase domain-containing protein, partial [Methylovirgula sp.]